MFGEKTRVNESRPMLNVLNIHVNPYQGNPFSFLSTLKICSLLFCFLCLLTMETQMLLQTQKMFAEITNKMHMSSTKLQRATVTK